jgi:hypothetical protein
MAMEYRFINADSTKVTMDVTLGDIADLRDVLTKALDAKLEDVSRWTLRQLIRQLAETQAKAAETMAYEAKGLGEKAKLPEGF